MTVHARRVAAFGLSAIWLVFAPAAVAEPSAPLVVREGWKVELVAQAPEIKHPSAVCTAPDGRVFVAEDPMDIREDTPPDSRNGRIVCIHPESDESWSGGIISMKRRARVG